MKQRNLYLLLALFAAFLLFGLGAFMQSKPAKKNQRIYQAVQHYSPYYLDKRFGGLQIMSKEDPEFKEKPNNMTLFKEFERLERAWGQKHLQVEEGKLLIFDNNGTKQATIPLQNKEERTFIQHYYGV